jgi:hypothetical protein
MTDRPRPETIEAGLRGASDGLLIAIQELGQHERIKRGVPPGDPRFPTLARSVRQMAEDVLRLAAAEESFATEASASPEAASLSTIDATEIHGELAKILGEWRLVERELDALEIGSPESQALIDRFDELRDRYAVVLARIRARDEG